MLTSAQDVRPSLLSNPKPGQSMIERDCTNQEVDDLENKRVPQSLEELIETQRTRMHTALTLLGCTKAAMENEESAIKVKHDYGTMIELAWGMTHKASEQLDSRYLRAFYDELATIANMRQIKSTPRGEMTIEVMGGRWPLLAVDTNVCQCGTVTDGISLSHYRPSSVGDWDACWVISFSDLEAIYQSALAKRGRAPVQNGTSKGDAASTHSDS